MFQTQELIRPCCLVEINAKCHLQCICYRISESAHIKYGWTLNAWIGQMCFHKLESYENTVHKCNTQPAVSFLMERISSQPLMGF